MSENFTELDGLVIREVKVGEKDKLITLLTAEEGLITISPGLIDAYILTNVFLRFIDDICD